jgi:hypothetical protein
MSKRKIVHHYDPVNDYRWADVFHIYPDQVKITRYRAGILSGKKGYRQKERSSPTWIGRGFLKTLNQVLKGR